jgi:fibronectin-binding autotransporter adhesin
MKSKKKDLKGLNPTGITGIVASVLCLFSVPPAGAQATWTGGASPDLNWSTGGNWSGGTGGSGEPGAGDAVVFGETGVVTDSSVINNTVDLGFAGTIAALTYNQTNSGEYHVTEIPAGQTLNVSGDVTVGRLNADTNYTEVFMTGGGTFAPAGTTFYVGNHGANNTSPYLHATLDMSGLSNFVYDVSGGTWIVAGSGGDARGGGVLNLAGVSNNITVGTINFNTGSGNNSSFHSLIQLGAGTNIINVGTFVICQTKARFAEVQFLGGAPATAGLRLRGVDGNADDASRATLTLGDRENSGSGDTIGQLLLNGHPVDIKADVLTVGQDRTSTSSTSTRSGQGVLEFDNGTVDANTVLMANLTGTSSSSTAIGTITVGANGTLLVGTGGISLVRQDAGSATGNLEISGGNMQCSGDIFKATTAGTANIAVNGGALNVGGALGGADAPIDSLDISDATLTLAAAVTANAHVATLTCGGTTNVINFTTVPAVTGYPSQPIPIIQYAGSLGGTFNIGAGTFPPSNPPYAGYLANNTADGSIDLVVTSGPKPARVLTWDGVPNGDWDTSTMNWTHAGTNASYSAGDFVRFDDSASGTTVVNLTGTMTPASITVSNETKNYGFTGAGHVSGDIGIIKDGAATLYITNSANDNTGGLIIHAGTVQVGDGAGSGNLGSGGITDHGLLIYNRADAVTVSDTISGSGSLTKQGTGSLELTVANSYDGTTSVQAGTLKTSDDSALGTTNGPTTVSAGASLDVNGHNLGAEPVNVSGMGDGGNGAIINSGSDQTHALQYVALQGDTWFGGPGRWDIRSPSSHDPSQAGLNTGGQPYKLIKTGANQISLVAIDVDSKLGDVEVQQGILSLETETTGLGNPASNLTVAAGASLQFYQLTNELNKVISLNSDGTTASLINDSGANTVVGPVTLLNDCFFTVNGTSLALNGGLSGGSLTKNGFGNLIIGGNATEAGITANLGQLTLNGTHTGPITCNYLILPVAFAGTGTNYGTTDLSGPLFPGDTNVVGTITLSGLTLEGDASVGFDLGPDNAVGGIHNDLIQVNGDLTINGNAVHINPMGLLQLDVPYRLANYTGNLTWNGDLTVTEPNGQYIFTVDTNTPGQINLLASGGPPVWDGGSAADSNWSDAANWGGMMVNPGNLLFFAGITRLNNTNDTADGTSYNGITFDVSAGAFVLNGNSVTLAGGIGNHSTNTQTVNLALSINGDTALDGGSGGLNLAGAFADAAAGGTQTLTLAGNGSLVDSITIATGGQLTILTGSTNSNWTLLDNAASDAVAMAGELNIYNGGTFTFGATNSAPDVTMIGSDGTGSQRNLIGNETETSMMNMVGGNLTLQTRLNIGNGTAGATLNVFGGTMNVESSSISIADNNASTVGAVNISGGTLNTGPATNPAANTFYVATRGTGTLTVSGTGQLVCGTLDVSRNASSAGSTGVVNLDGGTVTASRVSSGTSATGASGTPTALFNFNGGVLTAGASSTTWFQGRQSAPAIPVVSIVKSGGAIIDTTNFDVTVLEEFRHDPDLAATPDGGLVKLGTGTLTLSGTNSYTGKTTVNGGTLEIAQATLAPGSTVSVAGGATLQLDFTGMNTVAALVLNGVSQPEGVYNATTSPGYLAGAGSLQVGAVAPPGPTITGISLSGTTLTLTAANGMADSQFILLGSTNLALPLSSWTPVLTNNFDGSGSLNLSTNIVDPNNPQEFYILKQ